MYKRAIVLTSCILASAFFAGSAAAVTSTWSGGYSGESWCDPLNWSAGVPGPTDDAEIGSAPAGVAIPSECDANVGSISGPSGSSTIDIDGTLALHSNWGGLGDGSTINIGGNSIVRIFGQIRTNDGGTTSVNITGDPNIILDGLLRGADGCGSTFNFSMSGGYFQAQGLMFGDDGGGTCSITGGTVNLGSGGLQMKARSDCGGDPAAYVQFTLDGGAYVETTGGFGCPTEADGSGDVYLNSGTLICNSFDSDGFNWTLDIDEGVIWKIKGDRISQIQNLITNTGQITGKNGTEEPLVIFDGEYTRVGFDLFQGPATKPNPSSPTSGICPENGITLTWTAGEKAQRHEVYFGTNWDDVNDATTAVDPCGVYQGSQNLGNESYPTGWLEYGKTYYWRIDEVNDTDPCTWKGAVWQFSTENGRATDPSPPNGRRGIRPGPVLLQWTPPCYLTAQTLYYGTDPCSATWTPVALGPSDDSYELPSMSSPAEHYYWRVDTTAGALGTITGNTWDFTIGFGGRLMYYKFDGSGPFPSPITDDSGNSIQFIKDLSGGGTITYGASNPVINPGSGASADFDSNAGLYRNDTGANDFLRLSGSEYTIEMWVKPESWTDSSGVFLISKLNSWGLEIHTDNDFEFRFQGGGGQTDNDSAVLDEWHHVAVVYDQSDEGLSGIYLNGNREDGGGGMLPADNNNPIWIGVKQLADNSFRGYFDGQIDEIRVHDIAVGPCGLLTEYRDPEYPLCPYPENTIQDIDPCGVVLTWLPGESATEHDVYFSTEESDVQNLEGSAFLDTYDYPMSDSQVLDYGTTYYWRVVEQPGGQEGEVWKFTTQFIVDDDALRLHYKLDETSGDTAYDSSGYGNHGDVDGDDGWDPEGGQFGGAFNFNDDSSIDAPGEATLSISPSISISCWLKDSFKLGGNNFVFGVGNGLYEIRAAVPMADGRTIEWRAGNDSNDVLLWDMFRDNIDPRTLEDWHHWVFVKDETAGEMKIYFDGELAEANDVVDTTLIRLRESGLSIGAASGNPDDLVGSVDDFRLYDIALDDVNVTKLFRGGELELAWSPDPRSGATAVDPNVVLRWRPGDFAVEHDVYIGNTKSDVVDANTSTVGIYVGSFPNSPDNNYPLPASLPLGSIRYWRIDEVNGPNTWKGRIWSFTVADFIIIDNFEQYDTSGNRVYNTWCDQRCQLFEETGSWLTLAKLPSYPVNTGSQSVEYWYNTNDMYAVYNYAEAWLPLASVGFTDWTSVDVRLLTLFFYGDPINAATETEQMYVGVKDTDGLYGEMRYGDHSGEALTDIQVDEWQRWDIPFVWFTDSNSAAPNDVNFADVETLHIGFGNRRTPVAGGEGWVYFDDILLSKPVCRPEYGPTGDLDGDCFVGIGDIGAIGDEWLRGDISLAPVTNPGTGNLVGHWELDGNANDSSAYGNHGTAEGAYAWVTGRVGSGAIELNGGKVLVGDSAELRPSAEISATAWVNYSQATSYSARVVVKGIDAGNNENFAVQLNGDTPDFFVRDSNHNNYPVTGDSIGQGEWAHVAGTYDGNAVKCYVNGQLSGSEGIGLITLLQDSNDLAIGNRTDANDRAFRGVVDDVRVYNRALTRAEVAYLASEGDGILEMESATNLFVDYPDPEIINFKDLAKLFDYWGSEQLWPPEVGP